MVSESFDIQVQQFFADAKVKAADGLTLAEAGQIVLGLIVLAVNAAFGIDDDGAKKKAFVLGWLSKLFDEILPALPLPFWLAWVKFPFFREAAKALFLKYYGGEIETIVAWAKQVSAPVSPSLKVPT